MFSKIKMNTDNNPCQACLSTGRTLYPIVNLFDLFQEASFWELSITTGGICWECLQIIKNFAEFRAKVRTAQGLLLNADKVARLSSLSKLKICNPSPNSTVILIYQSHNNEQINLQKLNKEEEKARGVYYYLETENETQKQNLKEELSEIDIKQEINTESDDNLDRNWEIDEKSHEEQFFDEIQSFEVKPTSSEVYIDEIKLNNDKKPKKKVKKRIRKKRQEPEDEILQKFTQVEFTEEEMLRSRERKRNHPNFKKLQFKCDSCVLGFTRKDNYDAHMDKKHDERAGSLICPVCTSRFRKRNLLERHKRKHYLLYRCKLCDYGTVELWCALNHAQGKHFKDHVERIHCSHCVFVAKSKEELSQHMTLEHSAYCKDCGKTFKKIVNYKKHMIKVHAMTRKFVCDICSKSYNTKSRLESHMATHSTAIAQKLAYCAICNIQFKNLYVYRHHLRNSASHVQKTYQCKECNKRFASKVYWKKHYNFYHLHKSEFQCEICNKLFISEWRLKGHLQTQHGHDRTRDHRCADCGKQFYTSSTLRGHQLTHSALRSFMCEDCGDTFKQRPALYTHCRLVHRGGKRPRVARGKK